MLRIAEARRLAIRSRELHCRLRKPKGPVEFVELRDIEEKLVLKKWNIFFFWFFTILVF